MMIIAALSVVLVELFASRVAIRGRNPLEPVMVAILLGIALRAVGWVPSACGPGLRHYEIALKLGIVLLGLSLTLAETLRLGAQALSAIVTCVVVVRWFVYTITRWAGVTRNLGILLGVGTTICGTAAIAAVAPVIAAKDEEVSYAVSTVSLFGAVAMIALPVIGGVMAMTDVAFGVWAGLAVPSTPQVVGTGYMYSEGAGAQATVVKLTRNIFIIPTVFSLSLSWRRRSGGDDSPRRAISGYASALPGFVFGFLALAVLRSIVDAVAVVPAERWHSTLSLVAVTAKALVLIAMAGIGLNTRFHAMRTIGATPLLVGFLSATFLGAVSYVAIRVLGIG